MSIQLQERSFRLFKWNLNNYLQVIPPPDTKEEIHSKFYTDLDYLIRLNYNIKTLEDYIHNKKEFDDIFYEVVLEGTFMFSHVMNSWMSLHDSLQF